MKYLKYVSNEFYSYFDSKKQMFFTLKKDERGIYGKGNAWYLKVIYGGAERLIATFSIKDDGHGSYRSDYGGRIWTTQEVFKEADAMVSNILENSN